MFCEECHIRPVSLKIQIFTEGQPVERALCQICGQKYAGARPSAVVLAPMQPFALLSGMLTLAPQGTAPLPGPTHCEHCAYAFQQFQQNSMLGCPRCYESFAPQMEVILRRAHGGTVQHGGKIPRRRGEKLEQRRALRNLSRELEQAILEQRFEDAATLRDRMQALERELNDA